MSSKYDYTPEQEAAAQALVNGGGRAEKKDYADPRQFKPAITDGKKAGDKRPVQYQALVRILPRGMDKSKPFCVPVQEHFYSENNITFSKKCRKTFGENEACPVCDAAWKLYNIGKNSNDEAIMKIAKKRLPKLNYFMNIFVIQDAITPANNGKVMIWKVTKNMYEIIVSAMKKKEAKPAGPFNQIAKPELAPFYPYHVLNSYNLLVDLVKDPKTGFPSYEGSDWYDTQSGFSPLAKTEQEIDAILAQCNDLTEFTSDILGVEELAQELIRWQGRVNLSTVSDPNAGVANMQMHASTPNMAQPVQGNSAAFFGVPVPIPGFNQPVQQAPVAPAAVAQFPQASAPMQQAPVMQAPIQSSSIVEDPDLPF